jgi:pSer/pThr/pTyr-binding forkhead associated (FHA) protein
MVDIVLTDPEVSRQHARLILTDTGYQIQDLGSTNGTFVDGRRLGGEQVVLVPGVIITMGSNVTLVYDAAPDPLATIVSPEAEFDFAEEEISGEELDEAPESGEEVIDEVLVEAAELEDAEMPATDDAKAEGEQLEEADVQADAESTSVEFPPAVEPVPLPADEPVSDYEATRIEEEFSWEEAEGEELPAFDEGTPVEPADDQRTVLEFEAEEITFGYEQEQPETEAAEAAPSPEMPAVEEFVAPKAAEFEQPPPPPPPPPASEAPKGRSNRNAIIIAVVLLLLLCCCSLTVLLWYTGDVILSYLNF